MGLQALNVFRFREFVRKELSKDAVLAFLRLRVQQLLKISDIVDCHPLGMSFCLRRWRVLHDAILIHPAAED